MRKEIGKKNKTKYGDKEQERGIRRRYGKKKYKKRIERRVEEG